MHEQLDVKMIRLIQEEILPRASHTPPNFITHVMTLLNRGSVHATAPQPLTTGTRVRWDVAVPVWLYACSALFAPAPIILAWFFILIHGI